MGIKYSEVVVNSLISDEVLEYIPSSGKLWHRDRVYR